MGFLIQIAHEMASYSEFQAALTIHHLWHPSYQDLRVNMEEKCFKIACTKNKNDFACRFWSEKSIENSISSFIYFIGWCYLINSSRENPTDSECWEMLNRYRKGLPPVDDAFSGNYVVIVYDAERGRIAVQPDRWAMNSVYFSVSEKGIIASNRAVAVASLVSASLDGYSIFSLMRGTHMPFGRSLFSGVHRVMCGCYLDIDISTIRIEVKRAFPIYVPTYDMNFKESVEAVSKTLRSLAQRLTRYRSSIFDLTGGNDTRLTAAAISCGIPDELRCNLAWRVAGTEDHPDVQIARQIARIYNWKLFRLDKYPPIDASLEELQRATVRADGNFLVASAFARIQQETAHQDEWDWLVGSIGGELFRGFFWRHEMLSLGRTTKVDYAALLAYRLYASRGIDYKLFGRDAPSLKDHDGVLLDSYRQIDRVGDSLLNPYKLDVMYLHKLCYSAGNQQSWLMGLRNTQLPLLSWEVTRLALSIPWRLRFNRRLILHAIVGLDSRFASIPNDQGEPMKPLKLTTLPFYMKAWLHGGVKTFPRVIQRYTGFSRGGKGVTVKPPPASWISIVTGAKYVGSLCDPFYIKSAFDNIRSPSWTPDKLRTFDTLLTIELLLRAVPSLRDKIEFDSGLSIQ
jgi:hypothetical protein